MFGSGPVRYVEPGGARFTRLNSSHHHDFDNSLTNNFNSVTRSLVGIQDFVFHYQENASETDKNTASFNLGYYTFL